jgi:hypothetical protein
VETRNHEHIDTICNALADAGFDVTCQIH